MTIGTQLQRLRKARSLTQEDVARRARLSQVYVCRIERGKANPSSRVVRRLAKALKVAPGDLF